MTTYESTLSLLRQFGIDSGNASDIADAFVETFFSADIYRQHAAERLRAGTMEQRWRNKTNECNQLREIIATLNEKLEKFH